MNTYLPNINELNSINIKNTYESFIEECCGNRLYLRIIDNAKKNRKRLNLLTFDVKDKINNIPYCAILQGTHKTNDQNALFNFWVREFKKSNLPPVIDEINNRLNAKNMGYTVRVYKYWIKKWAIELEWEEDTNHNEKINEYLINYGFPY